MSDTTTPSSPVVDPSRRDDVEKAASPDTKPEGVVMTWQLKALLAGRTPLPSSRPKRKSDEMERSESSEYPDSSTLKEDAQSVKCVNGSRIEDDKENMKVKHVVGIMSVDISTASVWMLTSHRLRNPDRATPKPQGSNGVTMTSTAWLSCVENKSLGNGYL